MANWGILEGDAFIPEYWAMSTLDSYEVNLLLGNLVDRSYEAELGPHNSGDKIHVTPVTFINSSTARVKAAGTDVTSDAPSTETNVDISVGTHVYQSAKFEDIAKLQAKPNAVAKYTERLGYTVAKKTDTDLAAQIASFTNARGTLNVDVTEEVLDLALEDLDTNEVPDSNRVWVFHVKNKRAIMSMERFINRDYTSSFGDFKPGVSRKIFGSIHDAPVWFTNNLVANTSGHDNVYMHKEALALVVSLKPRVQAQYKLESLATLVVVDTIYGVKIMRNADGAVWVKGK